jgi:adenine-specific DNA-methyltransferase
LSNFNWNYVSKEGDIQYPNGKKPINFIKRMIEMTASQGKGDFILDFFAGSGSTAQAVIDMNIQDFGTRKSISVQLPELVSEKDKKKYYSDEPVSQINYVSDIFIARLKRAIDKYKYEIAENTNKNQAEIAKLKGQLPTDENKSEIKNLQSQIQNLQTQDLGFKVMKLSDSNFKQWQQIKGKDAEALEQQMKFFVDPVSENATTENMVYELMLKSGKDLNSKLEHKDNYYCVNENELIFMHEKATQEIVDEVIKTNPQKVIALDRLFKDNDQLKTNTSLQMRDAGIEFKTI